CVTCAISIKRIEKRSLYSFERQPQNLRITYAVLVQFPLKKRCEPYMKNREKCMKCRKHKVPCRFERTNCEEYFIKEDSYSNLLSPNYVTNFIKFVNVDNEATMNYLQPLADPEPGSIRQIYNTNVINFVNADSIDNEIPLTYQQLLADPDPDLLDQFNKRNKRNSLKPMAPYVIFRKQVSRRIGNVPCNMNNEEISMLTSKLWSNLSNDKKEAYKNLASEYIN
ncbi:20453_t:CDS:2, partial [Racocetra persica]